MTVEPVDIAWLLACAALVLLMQAGFTALESGLVRTKNSINVAIKNFANLIVAGTIFWLFGFGLEFGSSASGILGTSSFLFESPSPFLIAFFLFQLGFIATATTLVSGAVAERMRFGGYVVMTVFVASIVYPLFGHWTWGDASILGESGANGWLNELGFIDFAGSTTVHSVGGWVALAAVIVLGPRIGRFGPEARPIRGHDLPLTTVGVFLLWVGWYGFNGGSTFGLSPDVPSVILNTTVAAMFGGAAGMVLTWRLDPRADVVTIMNSALGGLVAVTASANLVTPAEAAVIGAAAAVVVRLATALLERARVDDAVGAVPVHLASGVWGTLAVALFGDVASFPAATSRVEQVGLQLVGIGVCFVWAFGLSLLVLSLVNRRFALRIDEAGERAGLNIAQHAASTEIADLLVDMDVQRRSGTYDRPVRVEPNTEVGQIAAQYNRVLAAIGQRTESLQLLRRTAVAANESSSVEKALELVLDEVCGFTGWPIGHAFLADAEDPLTLVSAGVSRATEAQRYEEFLVSRRSARASSGQGLVGIALESRRPVFASLDTSGDGTAESVTLTVASRDPAGASAGQRTVFPLTDGHAESATLGSAAGLRGGVAVPIIAGSDAVGVLEFFSESPFVPDADLGDLLLSVGTQLGRVVERQRSEEARLRALIDNMPASVYLRDPEGRYILVNRQYEEFWGIRNADIRGKTLFEAVPASHVEADPETIATVDREVLANGATRRIESRVLRLGEEHVIADLRFPVLDGGGRAVAVAGIDIDITADRRREAELGELVRRVEMARDAAVEAGMAKSRFLANVSHELRTPLNAIIGFSRIVSRNAQTLPQKQVDNLSKILVSAQHLLALIDEILDLSRIEAGEVHLDVEPVEVLDVVREVTASLEPLVDGSRVELVVDVDPGLPEVATDREKLTQILLNLLGNAVKYTDSGRITVQASVLRGRLSIRIADTGVGIPRGELAKVFDEFHRVSTEARHRRGTGLGLTISRRFAQALGGDVTVESALGVGSTFTVDLPLVDQTTEEPSHGTARAEKAPHRRGS